MTFKGILKEICEKFGGIPLCCSHCAEKMAKSLPILRFSAF